MFGSVAKNTLYQVLARIVSTAASFFITIVIARHFGLAGYGDFAKITAFVTIFYVAIDFGLNAVFLQYTDSKVRFRELFYTRILFSFFLIFLVNILTLALPFNALTSVGFSIANRIAIAIFSFTLLTEAIVLSSLAVFQRNLSYQYIFFATALGSFLTLFLIGMVVWFSYPLVYVFLSFLCGGIAEAIFALILSKEVVTPLQMDSQFVKKLIMQTFPVGFVLIINLLYFRIDIILLSLFKSSQDVALYDLATKVFDFLLALPLFLSNALYPFLLKEENFSRIANKKVFFYACLFALFGILSAIPMWFLSPLLGEIKKEFILVIVPLRILLLFLPIFFITSIIQWILLARKQQKKLVYIYLLGAILNVASNLVFIPTYGVVASAIITGAGEILILILLLILLCTNTTYAKKN